VIGVGEERAWGRKCPEAALVQTPQKTIGLEAIGGTFSICFTPTFGEVENYLAVLGGVGDGVGFGFPSDKDGSVVRTVIEDSEGDASSDVRALGETGGLAIIGGVAPEVEREVAVGGREMGAVEEGVSDGVARLLLFRSPCKRDGFTIRTVAEEGGERGHGVCVFVDE
jgi:hypothetical protein